jgi:hypothetical protein
MRGPIILVILLWAVGATAEERVRREEPRAAILEALEVQAGLPEQLPQLPEAASPVAESARETATEGARRGKASRTRGEVAEKARGEASKHAPGASSRAARSAALDAAGVGAEAREAAGRSRAEAVRKNKPPKPDSPGNGRPTQPAPIRRP